MNVFGKRMYCVESCVKIDSPFLDRMVTNREHRR
jgi:hypothetical protein